MNQKDALARVERLMDELGGHVSGKGHYKIIRLIDGRTLGIDVFDGKNTAGHIRVHVFNVTSDEAAALSLNGAPQVPGFHPDPCPKCHSAPEAQPSHYSGPREDSGREYFGFQWHAGNELMEADIACISQTARWLLQHFPLRVSV